MKIFIGILFIALSTFAGYLFTVKYRERLDFYRDFSEFNKRFKSAVSFSSSSVKEVLENTSSGCFSFMLSEYKFGAKEKTEKPNFLTADEYSAFLSYIGELGTSDKSTQITFLEDFQGEVSEKLSAAEEKYKKIKPLYIKLGFLTGLMLFVLIL